jgi:hypothetical protein
VESGFTTHPSSNELRSGLEPQPRAACAARAPDVRSRTIRRVRASRRTSSSPTTAAWHPRKTPQPTSRSDPRTRSPRNIEACPTTGRATGSHRFRRFVQFRRPVSLSPGRRHPTGVAPSLSGYSGGLLHEGSWAIALRFQMKSGAHPASSGSKCVAVAFWRKCDSDVGPMLGVDAVAGCADERN